MLGVTPLVVPGCGTRKFATVYGATASGASAVIVLLAGVVQSTWTFHAPICCVPELRLTTTLGAPAGGGVVPSRSAGIGSWPRAPVEKHCCVAAAPASILARSSAHTGTSRLSAVNTPLSVT